jgi:hypothetical protein
LRGELLGWPPRAPAAARSAAAAEAGIARPASAAAADGTVLVLILAGECMERGSGSAASKAGSCKCSKPLLGDIIAATRPPLLPAAAAAAAAAAVAAMAPFAAGALGVGCGPGVRIAIGFVGVVRVWSGFVRPGGRMCVGVARALSLCRGMASCSVGMGCSSCDR